MAHTKFPTIHPLRKRLKSVSHSSKKNILYNDKNDDNERTKTETISASTSSKRKMLTFAIPALGIFLSAPLLSNIDNAFVGRTVGTSGLAALSPATICTDQLLYLFSFLSRATTGIVSRAYATPITNGKHRHKSNTTRIREAENTKAAQEAAAAPLTVSLLAGLSLTTFYALFTPQMLSKLNVDPELVPTASSYIYWRGAIAPAALAQSVSLSILLATGDARTPLKIVALSALVNVCGDALLCVWPWRFGCTGAAIATAFATLYSSFFMLKVLSRKRLLPPRNGIHIPTKKEWAELIKYAGPLLAITITRLTGFVSMQRAAMRLGVAQLASYQLCVNTMLFFILFAEPLSQLSQTKVPALLLAGGKDDDDDSKSITEMRQELLATLKSVLTLASFTALVVGGIAYSALMFGSIFFTTDVAVQAITKDAAPAVFMAVAQAIMAISIDGAMLASRDFGYMLVVGIATCAMQLNLLKSSRWWFAGGSSLVAIFGTFALRLGIYAVAALVRVGLGFGPLGEKLGGIKHLLKNKGNDGRLKDYSVSNM